MLRSVLLFFIVAVFSLVITPAAIGQDCPASALSKPKGNKLYLYFPSAIDNTFPEYGSFGVNTSPLAEFDVADLDGTIGTTTQLRNRIFKIVTNEYCEFNIEVAQVTAKPTPTEARWQIVGVGTDGSGGTGLAGEAQNVDLGDNIAQDYARVWAGAFEEFFTDAGEALNGTNSTLERWARAIASTVTHETGHNYGLGHPDANPQPGSNEDPNTNHIMISGGLNTGENRAGNNKHFSDVSYELLAHNVGLNVKTLYNWDFTNPNDVDAHSLELTLLSLASSLSIGWWYNGTFSPWRDPTISAAAATKTNFQGTDYNKFTLTFITDKSWSGGVDGVAPPAIRFHIGASFNESDPVIVYDAELMDNGGSVLPLHPRFISFDVGSADLISGDFIMSIFNSQPESGDLLIRDFNVQFLPRIVNINNMLDGVPLEDLRGNAIEPHGYCSFKTNFELRDIKEIRLANLSDERFVDFTYDSIDCKRGIINNNGNGDIFGGELEYCPQGVALSLFPSTAVYVTATVVDQNARYFDPDRGEFVIGPLVSKVFYQFVGIMPDFNENGVDDLTDIREGTSIDVNGNGVPDESDPSQTGVSKDSTILPWWVYLIILILIIIILILITRKRKM